MEAYIAWGEGADALVSVALGLNYSATSATWIYVPVSSWACGWQPRGCWQPPSPPLPTRTPLT